MMRRKQRHPGKLERAILGLRDELDAMTRDELERPHEVALAAVVDALHDDLRELRQRLSRARPHSTPWSLTRKRGRAREW